MASAALISTRRKATEKAVLDHLSALIEGVSQSAKTAQIHDLGGGALPLPAGAVHEWFDEMTGPAELWFPPLGILIHIARAASQHGECKGRTQVVWIGRSCWPYPLAMIGAGDVRALLLGRSTFVDARNRDERVWATDLALRCGAPAAVVADGRGLTMAESRRLQLAAEAGGAVGLIARPGWELNQLSVARTRWRVSHVRSGTNEPRWVVEMVRCKGARVREGTRRWGAWWDRETGVVHLDADVPDRPLEAAGSARDPKRRIA